MNAPPEDKSPAQKIFEGARLRTGTERQRYLREVCADDEQLQAFVEELLAADESDSDLLEQPIWIDLLTAPMLEPGELLRGRYRIQALVGSGGMGEVYEAFDTLSEKSPERIAIKTIRRDLSYRPGAQARLHEEIQAVHRVSHSNVCKVHHVDTATRPDGELLFLTMDFLEGTTLSDWIEKTGPLSVNEALGIASDIAAALDAAHAAGVVHRDLKSSNVMLVPQEGGGRQAVILDFGIAAGLERRIANSGSVDYMSPERFRDPSSDRPVDIYAFGVILFEMVVGRLPFSPGVAPSARSEPPSTTSLLGLWTGARWDRTIAWCLAPLPQHRPRTATDAVRSLQPLRWPFAVAAALLALFLFLPAIKHWMYTLTLGPRDVLAVFPFTINGTPENAGAVELLTEELQKSPSVREKWLIFPPRDIWQLKIESDEDARKKLGASHILKGSVTVSGDTLHISGQVAAASGSPVLGRFERTCAADNTGCLQNALVSQVAAVLTPSSFTPAPPDPIEPDALPFYLQGLYYLRRDSTSYVTARKFLLDAVSRSKGSARVRVALANTYVQEFSHTGKHDSLYTAIEILEEAARTHPGLSDVHLARGNVYRLSGRSEEAARELLVAVQADPSNHVAQRVLASTYADLGRPTDAVERFREAIRLQPRHWAGYLDYAVFEYRRGDPRKAAELLEQLIQWAPDHAQGLSALGGVYVDLKRYDDAKRISKKSCELSPNASCFLNHGVALVRTGNVHAGIDLYRRALALDNPSVTLLSNLAEAYLKVGDAAAAREFHKRAVERAQSDLVINSRNSGLRAFLAFSLARTGDRERSLFELHQAWPDAAREKNVRTYAVLTYEVLGMREQALDAMETVNAAVLDELEQSWAIDDMRKDARYGPIAAKIRAR